MARRVQSAEHPQPHPRQQQHYHHIAAQPQSVLQQPQHQPPPPPPQYQQPAPANASSATEIFVDPAMGTPLLVYVERDVPNLEAILALIKQHGGSPSTNYSTVPYILVDRTKESGQNLYRQYHNKKGKVVLDAQWIFACVQAGEMLTFKRNWGGFKLTGTELVASHPVPVNAPPEPAHERSPPEPPVSSQNAAGSAPSQSSAPPSQPQSRSKKKSRGAPAGQPPAPPAPEPHAPIPPSETRPHQQPIASGSTGPPQYGFPQGMPPPPAGGHPPPQGFPGWGHVVSQSPQQHPPQQQQQQQPPPPPPQQRQPQQPPMQQVAHLSQLHHRPPAMPAHPFGAPPGASAAAAAMAAARGHWYGVTPGPPPPPPVDPNQSSPRTAQGSSQQPPHPPPPRGHPGGQFPPHFDPQHWTAGPDGSMYYNHFPPFHEQPFVVPQPPPPAQEESSASNDRQEHDELPEPQEGESRGRKRKRGPDQGPPRKSKYVAPPPADPASLVPALAPFRRSPTPPSRVVKSTYGGNLFTAEDIAYLKAYIDWCVDMGYVLSLREICERLAIRAPHHTFYSWRRYCNKHKIKLGSYQMMTVDENQGNGGEDETGEGNDSEEEEANVAHALTNGGGASADPRRSPTPPKSLHRSTTGKGIAFTDEDVTYLVRYMTYKKMKDPALNMPQFWNELAAKAPHHSRASWLKYWRRHRHEIETGTEELDPSNPGSSMPTLQVPQHNGPASKRQRYSHEDDILLARFWATEPQGTSDKLFQDFARAHPHHPWKGWQEHHRIHKTQIDHLVRLHLSGVDLTTIPAPAPTKTGRPASAKDAHGPS